MRDIMIAGVGYVSAIPLTVEAGKKLVVVVDEENQSLLKNAIDKTLKSVRVISVEEVATIVTNRKEYEYLMSYSSLSTFNPLVQRPSEIYPIIDTFKDFQYSDLKEAKQSDFIYGATPTYIREKVHSRGKGYVKSADKRKKVKQARKLARISKRKRK